MEPGISYDLQQVAMAKAKSSWFVRYTRPHHEKNVYAALQAAKIDAYLPLQITLRQRSDKKKR
jgi:hypothetical protein